MKEQKRFQHLIFKMADSQRTGQRAVRARTCYCLGNCVPKVNDISLEETTSHKPMTFEFVNLLITHPKKKTFINQNL